MDVQPVNLVELLSAFMGISVVLVPVIGLTIRFAFKPLVEAIAVARGTRARDAELVLLEKRVELLERQLEQVQRGLSAGSTSSVLGLPERTRSSSLG